MEIFTTVWVLLPRCRIQSACHALPKIVCLLLQPGMFSYPYGQMEHMNGMRPGRLNGAMSDPYMAAAVQENYLSPGRSAPRSRTHLHHYSATDFSGFEPQVDDWRY